MKNGLLSWHAHQTFLALWSGKRKQRGEPTPATVFPLRKILYSLNGLGLGLWKTIYVCCEREIVSQWSFMHQEWADNKFKRSRFNYANKHSLKLRRKVIQKSIRTFVRKTISFSQNIRDNAPRWKPSLDTIIAKFLEKKKLLVDNNRESVVSDPVNTRLQCASKAN